MLLWGPKSEVPVHFVLRAQSLVLQSPTTEDAQCNSLKAQERGRGRPHVQHLIKTPEENDKFSTKAAQGRKLPIP